MKVWMWVMAGVWLGSFSVAVATATLYAPVGPQGYTAWSQVAPITWASGLVAAASGVVMVLQAFRRH